MHNDANRGLPCFNSQKDNSYIHSETVRIKLLAKNQCGKQWDLINSKNFYEISKCKENDAYISWIHQSKESLEAFKTWEENLLKGMDLGWSPNPIVKNEKSGTIVAVTAVDQKVKSISKKRPKPKSNSSEI